MIENEADRNDMYQRAAAHIERGTRPEPTPAREPTGQFRSSEPVYGREAEERAAGYKPLKEDRNEPDGLTVRDAATDRAKELQERPIEVHESGLKDNVTLSAEQAAKRIAESREADAKQAELDGTKAAQKAVDDLRGEKPAEVRQPQQIEAESDIEKVLSHPKVQSAITEKVTAAETQRQQWEAAARRAGTAEMAAIAADFPELMQLHPKDWVAAITAMHQREPARAKAVYNRLVAYAQVEAAVNQFRAQKEAGEKAEFTKYSARENQRFAELTKGMAPKEMAAIQAEVPAMLADYGVSDPRAFLTAIQGQTAFPRASAERIMVDAAKYRLMQKAAKPTPARAPLPPVQRPGVAAPRVSSEASNLRALTAKLNSTGDLKDATRLRAAQIAAQKKAKR